MTIPAGRTSDVALELVRGGLATAPGDAPTADRGPVTAAELPALLRQLVRAEFRQDVIIPRVGDDMLGSPACDVPDCGRPAGAARGLCGGHYLRWRRDGKPETVAWVLQVSPVLQGRGLALKVCAVPCCRRGGGKGSGLCGGHYAAFKRYGGGRAVEAWLPDAKPLIIVSPDCQVDGCPLEADSTAIPLCGSHRAVWRNAGRPPVEVICARTAVRGFPRFELHQLPPGLRLEVQYGLQCWVDRRTARVTPRNLQALPPIFARLGVTSLLDQDVEHIIAEFQVFAPAYSAMREAFVRFTVARLEDLRDGVGWDNEYPRDVWRLHRLGLSSQERRQVHFDRVPQPWLRALAKRWMRHRLCGSVSTATALRDLDGVIYLARFLARVDPSAADEGAITRLLLERWLGDVATRPLRSRTATISQVKIFLEGVARLGWAPLLPATAVFAPDDFPRRFAGPGRHLSEHLMKQLELEINLSRFLADRERLITEIIIGTGLRIGDAVALAADCVVRDPEGAAYLRYRNHKMRREAIVPVDEQLAGRITAHYQQAVVDFPTTRLLFPRPKGNPDGLRHISTTYYRQALRRWLIDCDVRNENGSPATVTPHQFRHTYGTRLVNKQVPLEVVRRLLDHTTHTMTAHYARISDTTVRTEWEKARKVTINGELTSLDPDSPLADAAWMKHSLSRVKMALPNGYCGLPLQQTCPHANACLDCPVFVTTPEFLPQHHQQLASTRRLIATAEADGHFRLVEMNRRVEANLTGIITLLEAPTDGRSPDRADPDLAASPHDEDADSMKVVSDAG